MKATRFALLLSGLALLMPARAHDVSAQIAALEERAKELRVREMLLQSQIRAEDGTATAAIGIAGAEARIRHNQMEIQKFEGLADIYKVSVEDMRRDAQRFADSDVFSLSEVPKQLGQQARDKAIQEGLKRAGKQAAGSYAGLISLGADIVTVGGRYAVRINDASRLRQEANAQHLQLNKVLEHIAGFQKGIQLDHQLIARLRDLQAQFSANNDALAETNRQIELLRNHRHDEPAPIAPAPAAGKPRGGVRLCDPSQQHRPVGVRQAQRAAPAADKEKQAPTKPGAACRDITGRWMLQQSIQVHGRSAPMGPPLRAEITSVANADPDAAPRYEIYGPDKASARNGPLMRCTREGHQLACQRRVQQQACPAAKYVWAALPLEIAEDVSEISGQLRQTWLMDPTRDPSGCTVVEGGQGTIGFRLVPAPR
jgi:hypothetical protein